MCDNSIMIHFLFNVIDIIIQSTDQRLFLVNTRTHAAEPASVPSRIGRLQFANTHVLVHVRSSCVSAFCRRPVRGGAEAGSVACSPAGVVLGSTRDDCDVEGSMETMVVYKRWWWCRGDDGGVEEMMV